MKTRALLGLASALVLAIAAGCGYSTPKEEDWDRIQLGMTKSQVLDRLGDPYMAQGSQLPGTSEDLFLYSDTTKYKEGERYAYYAVRFDQGRVVEKHRYLTKRSPQEVLAEINRTRMEERTRVLQEEGAQGEHPEGSAQPAGAQPGQEQHTAPPLPEKLEDSK
jgi:outer membrane protein assembly factor BamE (lipoprotein component of BamABCDE complex)